MKPFQFSLRTLLVLMALLAIPLGLIGWQRQKMLERDRAIAQADKLIQACGGAMTIGYAPPHCDVMLSDTNVTDDQFISMVRCFRRFTPRDREIKCSFNISLANTAVTDDSMFVLIGLRVNRMDISGTKVSDESIPSLQKIKDLEWINIANSEITSIGVNGLRMRMVIIGAPGLLPGSPVPWHSILLP